MIFIDILTFITYVIFVSIMLGLILFIYFLPGIVALHRKHHNKLAIFILNLFAGWLFIGWLLALIWACTKSRTVVVVKSEK